MTRFTLIPVLVASVAAGQATGLARARQLYNEHKYDEAIAAAGTLLTDPASASAAAVVTARARLDRYGLTGEATDLTEARAVLQRVDAARLTPRDGAEFDIALGQSLYFDERFGAAAELFELAMSRTALLDAPAYDRLLEWWSGSLDRQAQAELGPERRTTYARILRRSENELARDDKSAVASYWLAAAACGADDPQRGWDAAIAAWIRQPSMGPRGSTLRRDLDALIVEVVIPELAQRKSAGGDPRPAIASYQAQWDEVKRKWGGA